jgi:esterase/lipase superfamily enzyme
MFAGHKPRPAKGPFARLGCELRRHEGKLAKSLSARLRLIGCVMSLTALGGCLSPDVDSMTARVPGMGLLATQAASQPTAVSFFEVSTRKDGGESPDVGDAHFSLDMVSVPPDHQAGRIERPPFGKPSPTHDFDLTLKRPLSDQDFLNQVATYLSGRVGSNRDVLVYVHGFNTSEQDAQFRLSQIVVDGQFGGVPVLFTWPADGGPLSYIEEKDRATESRDALESLLSDLSHTPDIGRIHILAHSMGAWLAMEALRENAIAGHPDLDGHLGQVMLAAPDIDLAVFREQIARLKDPGRVSLFISTKDRALSLSGDINGDRRLGAVNLSNPKQRAEIQKLGVHVYDLSGYWDGFIGHGAYADLPQVVRSIGARLDAPRKEDADATAVIDLGVDHSSAPAPANPPTSAVEASPLSPPAGPTTSSARQ